MRDFSRRKLTYTRSLVQAYPIVEVLQQRAAKLPWGPATAGFITMLVAAARTAGVAPYIATGANRWPAVHRHDPATRFARPAIRSSRHRPADTGLDGMSPPVACRHVAEGSVKTSVETLLSQ